MEQSRVHRYADIEWPYTFWRWTELCILFQDYAREGRFINAEKLKEIAIETSQRTRNLGIENVGQNYYHNILRYGADAIGHILLPLPYHIRLEFGGAETISRLQEAITESSIKNIWRIGQVSEARIKYLYERWLNLPESGF